MNNVVAQIEQEIKKTIRLAPFPDSLEKRYQSDINAERQRHLIICLILGTLSFDTFLLWVFLLNPKDFLWAAFQMLGISTPFAAFIILAVRKLPIKWREAISLLPCYMGLAVSYNVIVNGTNTDVINQAMFIVCWPLMIVYVNTCMKSPFKIAFLFNVFVLTLTTSAVCKLSVSVSVAGLMLSAIWSSAFFSLLGNYWSSSEGRLNYLYRLREKERSDSLSHANIDLQRLSETDSLTGLANRRQVQPQLDQLKSDQLSGKNQGAVLLIDIDHFKLYNDHYGHIIGDTCLQQVASALEHFVRPQDTIARFGGEEFIIILPATSPDEARTIAAALLESIRLLKIPHLGRVDEMSTVSVSIGLAHTATIEMTEATVLLDQADRALYRAKHGGRDRFEDAGRLILNKEEVLITPDDIRAALTHNQFELHYQPLYQLQPNSLVGYECLIRWQHPKHGFIPPDQFIAIAERSGLISAVGDWVIENACAEASSWPGHLGLSVNVSPLQLTDSDFAARLADVLAKTGLTGKRLILEITEGAALHIDKRVKTLFESLRRLGVNIALDDFGQGHANLAYLLQLPFQILKIDRQVLKIANPVQRRQVLQALLSLGRAFDLQVLAEGVESLEDLELIRQIGFDHGQGYFLGRPQPVITDIARTA
jgi:diguanylate cyclase (GGDEF)-like protein